jgi:hypothetical protein
VLADWLAGWLAGWLRRKPKYNPQGKRYISETTIHLIKNILFKEIKSIKKIISNYIRTEMNIEFKNKHTTT